MAMSKEKKVKISWALVVLVIISNVWVGAGFLYGWDNMFWGLAIINLLFGPLCFIFYIREVFRGVFKYDASEEADTIDKQ